jgi:hypothetical protein
MAAVGGERDVVSWNAMLAAHVKVKAAAAAGVVEAKKLFARMPPAKKNIIVVSWTTMLGALSDAGVDVRGVHSCCRSI